MTTKQSFDLSTNLPSQLDLFEAAKTLPITPPKFQLLKWIGNKHRFALHIVSYFPTSFRRYYEPFLGSGAILATLAPKDALDLILSAHLLKSG